jgi:lipopolysaccharide/colanic/teichoic acid biosynthesis glycosyltransferase
VAPQDAAAPETIVVQPSRRRALRNLIRLGDILLVVASMGLAYFGHGLLRGVIGTLRAPVELNMFLLVGYMTLPVWLALLVGTGQDRIFERLWSTPQIAFGLLRVHLIGGGVVFALLWLTQIVVNRSVVALFFASSFVLLLLERALLARWAAHQFEAGHGRARVLLVGAADELEPVLAVLAAQDLPPLVVGHVLPEGDDGEPPAQAGDRLGTPSGIGEVLHEHAVDRVLLLPPFSHPADADTVIDVCEERGVEARFVLPSDDEGLRRPRVAYLYDLATVSYTPAPKRPEQLAVKHLVDVVAAAAGLVLLSPLLLLLALLVLLTCGRPVFFSQQRIGLNGRRFRMHKFRTMVAGAADRKGELEHLNEVDGPAFKARDDPRVTRLGRLLRRTSLDELPQLVNVLTGSMRGITGLWQVGGRSDLGFDEWMRLDLEYVDDWSPRMDVVILLKTIPAVILRRGAH